jgi:hypothetical protein
MGQCHFQTFFGVSNDEFVTKVYGQRLKRKVCKGRHPFSFFRIYKYNSHDCITAKALNVAIFCAMLM